VAAVDSELALLWSDGYPLLRWQPNPMHWRQPTPGAATLVMTSRLDGPTPALVKQMIDTSIAVEAHGLQGRVYVDARGLAYNVRTDGGWGYGGYDQSLRDLAALLGGAGLPVTLDNNSALFAPGSCPNAALYCGWYSLGRYVPCCTFVPGAVGYHIASSECISLRNPNVTFWCPNLLKNGCVATLGPVQEPYTVGFPKPAEFFGFLATGQLTLVESYWKTTTYTSWMMTLVGDPLYNPFGKVPRLRLNQVKPSPIDAAPPPN
jgi:uncharacterized protein (TIGR03790 family)